MCEDEDYILSVAIELLFYVYPEQFNCKFEYGEATRHDYYQFCLKSISKDLTISKRLREFTSSKLIRSKDHPYYDKFIEFVESIINETQ